MRIAFNGVGSGWGNNGGTQSVFRMADALSDLGADVEVWSCAPSRLTWFTPKTRVRVTTLEAAPEVDVLINAGSATTIGTYRFKKKKIGVQWLRGHEKWKRPESSLFDLYRLDMPLWANSEWMADMLKIAGVRDDCEVQYCGIPHQSFYSVDRASSDFLRIGCLWSDKKSKCSSQILSIANARELRDVRWSLFGDGDRPAIRDNMNYCRQPSMDRKRVLYSNCDIWIAPTELEGLHIPPMEAALCGAAVLAKAMPSAGNIDYCQHGITGLHYHHNGDAVEMIERLRDPELRVKLNFAMRKIIVEKIGDVATNARRIVTRLSRLL